MSADSIDYRQSVMMVMMIIIIISLLLLNKIRYGKKKKPPFIAPFPTICSILQKNC